MSERFKAVTTAQLRKAVYPYPVYQAHFADGSTARFSVYQVQGKPWDFGYCRKLIAGFTNPVPLLISGTRWFPKSRLYGKVHIGGQLEWKGQVFPDPMTEAPAPAKKGRSVPAKKILTELLAYLDGHNIDDSIIERARAAVA